MLRAYRFAAWRQFIYYRDIEVAVESHRKSTGNGGCCHHKYVWRNIVLCPHLRSLHHTETVLLIYHHKPHIGELHIILEYSVRTHKNIHRAVGKPLKNCRPILLLCAAREQFHTHRKPGEHTRYSGKMLLGKYLCRRHKTGLVAIILGKKHREKRDKGFSATNIALHKAVHLSRGIHIAAYLLHHPLLCPGEFKGKFLVIETVESIAHLGKAVPHITHLPVFGIMQYIQLYIEKFFKFKTMLCRLKLQIIFGKMYRPQRLGERHKIMLAYNFGCEGFPNLPADKRKEVLHKLCHSR